MQKLYKILFILPLIILLGCQAPGIKPLTDKELSGKATPIVQVEPKDIKVVVPQKDIEINVTAQDLKKAIDNNKPLKINVKLESSTNTIKLKTEPAQVQLVTKNFLVWWYGTIAIGVIVFILWASGALKYFKKKSKESKVSVDIEKKEV